MRFLSKSNGHWIALLLLCAAFAQLLAAATQLSATVDEGFHITSGYEYLRTGQLRLFDEHTPLAKALFAWPLFFVPDLTPPEQAPGYTDGNLIEAAQATILAYRPLDRVIVACRIPVVLLTLLLAASVYRWATAHVGVTAGLLSLALFTFDPNILAHGSLATTDMGATAFIFWTLLTFSHHLRHPTRLSWWSTALLLGLSQGAKLTALLLFPILGLIILIDGWTQSLPSQRKRALLARGLSYTGMVTVAVVVLWALYGFEVRPLPEIAAGTIPIPMASHLKRWFRLQSNLDYGRETFLLGQNSMHGWWLYFPIAFALKTPLPTLFLVTVVGASLILPLIHRLVLSWRKMSIAHHQSTRLRTPDLLSRLLFPAAYALLSLSSTINIGYRHLLPTLPFLYVLLSRPIWLQAQYLNRHKQKLIQVAYGGLLIWQIAGTVAIAPHFLAFFNEIAGGPNQGWQFLADSNTDWGQTFKALAAYQEKHTLGKVKLSTFTFYDPAAYGVDYTPIAPMTGAPPILSQRFNPEAGTYAISATPLDGVPLPYPPTFDWFRHREPWAKIGHVMFIYKTRPLQGKWIAQCSQPVAPLSSKAITAGFGIDNLRHINFDCTQSWVLPAQGQTPGWYAITIPEQTTLRWPKEDTQRQDLLPAWIAELPELGLTLSYLQPRHGDLPAFAMWACATCTLTPPQTSVELGKTLAYQGMITPSSAKSGQTIEVITFWDVLNPPQMPLSIMLHLRDAEGIPIAIGDSLGFPVEQWKAGDHFIQRHQLSIPLETPPGEYTLVTNAYKLESLQSLSDLLLMQSLDIQ